MIRRFVLGALDRGGAAGADPDAARAALSRVDLVVRGSARRRLGRALIDAELAVLEAGGGAGDAAPPGDHVMRVAALAVAKCPVAAAQLRDVDAVKSAYAALGPIAPPRRFPLATLVVALVALGGAGALAFAIVTHRAPTRAFEKPLPPPSALAFRTGGVPLHDPQIDAALAGPLTELVVSAGHAKDDGTMTFAKPLAELRELDFGHGAPLADAWQHALDAYGAAIVASQLGPTDRDADRLREAVRELTEQFAAAGLGYFLEGRFKRGYAYIQAYRVDEVAFVFTAGAPRRVLSIARLDHLNTAYAVLGMNAEDVGDPVIHVERIAEYVASTELPVLAPDAPYPLADESWAKTPEGQALAAAAGAAVRREYTAALGADADAGMQVAKLLVERAGIIDQWRDHLDRHHIVFARTDDLFVDPTLLSALDGAVPHYQLERVAAIDGVLAELEAPRLHGHLHALVAATVRRHEAQHGFDFDRDTELPYPARLEYLLGSPHDEQGNPVALVASARAELSAYTSQVVNDPITPHAALWHLEWQVFSKDQAGTGEFYAGVVLIEALAKRAGAAPALFDGRIYDRARLAKLALVVAARTDDQLRADAAGAWRDLFGQAPTVIVDAPSWY